MAVQATMDKIVALAKSRGFVFPGSEIYGGLANTWDYGPLGVEFKNNVKKAWWKKFIQESPYNVGLDSAILMNPKEALAFTSALVSPITLAVGLRISTGEVSVSVLALAISLLTSVMPRSGIVSLIIE